MATTMTRFASALLISCLVSMAAAAADIRIGGVSLRLPLPGGHCEIDPVLASDARLIASLHRTVMKTGNRLLILSADCAELKDWRNGKRLVLDHMAQFQSVLALEDGALPETPEKMIQNYCANVTALGDQAMPGTAPDAQNRAEQASKILRGNEMKYLGVVTAEPLICYAATLHKFSVENAGEFTQATIIAATVVKDKVLLSYLFAPYVGRQTIAELLTKQRVNVTRLQRANRN